MKTLKVRFKKEKETKNTVRYAEQLEGDRAPVINTLYISKTANPADELIVTIEAVTT